MGSANKDSAYDLISLYESIMQCEALDVPPAIVQSVPSFSRQLIEFIKNVENPNKKGTKNGKWYHYNDGTKLTLIGYGHKVIPGQDFRNGLTTIQVEHLLEQDLVAASIRARYYVNHEFGKSTWESLDQNRKEMLIEFTYNLGSLNSFPKFTKAVVHNDIGGMRKEYERFAVIDGEKKTLARNQLFFDTFLKNYTGGYFTSR